MLTLQRHSRATFSNATPVSPIEACNAGTVTAALLVLLRLGGGANPTVAEIKHNAITATTTKVLETNFIMMMLDADASKEIASLGRWIDLVGLSLMINLILIFFSPLFCM